jgi:dipeptidyl aminopeptidase/acylaminoacyl peptidase
MTYQCAARAAWSALLLAFVPCIGIAQVRPVGPILDDRPCRGPSSGQRVLDAWADDTSGYREWLTAGRYRRLVADWTCRRIVYLSEGLRVAGFIYRPTASRGRWPAIVVNRGGTGEFGKMHDRLQSYYLPYLDAGYVLLMSQYRGADGGEGHDEYSGADTMDVSNLVALARTLPYVDPDNVFMLGFSRGGMMTYRALAMGLPIRAAATVSGLTDVAAQTKYRPEMRDSVFRLQWEDFDRREQDHYRLRSAVRWPGRISTPLLLLHGTGDDRVRSSDALALAAGLDSLGRTYELVIYAGDGHGVPAHKMEADRRVLEWFRRFRLTGGVGDGR